MGQNNCKWCDPQDTDLEIIEQFVYISIKTLAMQLESHQPEDLHRHFSRVDLRTLAWKIPWTKEPGGLQSMGSLKSQTGLSNFTFTFHFHALEKAMATPSSVLAWGIPGMGEPGGLPSMGLHWVGHGWSDLAAAAALRFKILQDEDTKSWSLLI